MRGLQMINIIEPCDTYLSNKNIYQHIVLSIQRLWCERYRLKSMFPKRKITFHA